MRTTPTEDELDRYERAAAIKAAIQHSGLTDDVVADRTGRHRDTVARWCNGRNIPTVRSEYRLATVLCGASDRSFSPALFPPVCRLRPQTTPAGAPTVRITACPECDSSSVRRSGTGVGRVRADGPWTCEACSWSGADIVTRNTKPKAHTHTHSGPSRALLNADPDEFP